MALDVPECVRLYIDQRGGIDGIKALVPPEEKARYASRIFHALASPVRLKILHLLAERPLCPCILVQAIGIASSKLSYHLSSLQSARLIRGEQRGRWIMYELTPLGRDMLRVGESLAVEGESK